MPFHLTQPQLNTFLRSANEKERLMARSVLVYKENKTEANKRHVMLRFNSLPKATRDRIELIEARNR